ncbi:MAG TPA: hypothetical protein VI318_08480 [Baekduia sp.]
MRGRWAAALLTTCGVAAGGVTTATAAAPAPAPQVAADAKGDVRSPLDLTRFALARSSDGRLRASLTLAAAWDGRDLLSSSGNPGSLCLKLWTTSAPPDTTPQWLVCVTAGKDAVLRGSVLQQRANKLPARTGGADVSRPSDRSVTIRFSQTAIGQPATLYAAAEAARPGCPRGSCVDLAPDAPSTLTLKLKATK